jgi:hypothetical protein
LKRLGPGQKQEQNCRTNYSVHCIKSFASAAKRLVLGSILCFYDKKNKFRERAPFVPDMYAAYGRVRLDETAFGCFMMGPSATADVGCQVDARSTFETKTA